MYSLTSLAPVDYLVIGHITRDLSPLGERLGGTAAYAALTAQALGLRVGVVTSWGEEIPLGRLRQIPIASFPADSSTTFENLQTPEGRAQHIYHTAPALSLNLVPEPWRNPSIVHLGPVAQEVEPSLVRNFPSSLIGVTPQGWLRRWDANGLVRISEWPESSFVLQRVGACIISIDDVGGDEDIINELASSCRILAVTEGVEGARLYWNGDVRRFRAPKVTFEDDTGAGDIFASAFLVRLFTTRDPWEAARFATMLASFSVRRSGLDSIPTPEEIEECMVEVF
jgi:sugar/nucleoside kinase (ribokinase family)